MLAENHTEPVKASLADAVEKIGMSPSVMPKIPTPGALINETNTKRAEELLDALEDSGHDFKISFDATGKPVVEVDGNDDGKFSREQTGRGVLHGIPDLTSHDRSPVGIGAVGSFDTVFSFLIARMHFLGGKQMTKSPCVVGSFRATSPPDHIFSIAHNCW